LIFGADDDFTSIAIHADEALGFLNLLHQILDGHGQVSICSLSDRALRHLNRNIPPLGWVSRAKNPAWSPLEVASPTHLVTSLLACCARNRPITRRRAQVSRLRTPTSRTHRGTQGSNPACSSGEFANHRFRWRFYAGVGNPVRAAVLAN